MKIKFHFFLLVLITLLFSCSNDDSSGQSSEFRFLEFEKDVLLPAINSREITFYGLNFDNNLNNWELNLVNENNTSFPIDITSINDTPYGFKNTEILQEIKFNAPPFGNGDYSLTITNISSGQIYTNIFLVRSNIFDEIKYKYQSSYNLTASVDVTKDLYYFHNITNTITSDINTNSIVGINLQNTDTFSNIDIDYSINSDNKIEFIIPTSVDPGTYYLSIEYNNLINSYFEKDILVLEEQSPIIGSINKNIFQGGEIMAISGENFRYNVNFDFLPINDLFDPYPNSGLIFKDATGTGQSIIYPFESDPTYSYINSERTEINFPIPTDQFFITDMDSEGYYFEGEVIVRSGPYLSEPISIRINY